MKDPEQESLKKPWNAIAMKHAIKHNKATAGTQEPHNNNQPNPKDNHQAKPSKQHSSKPKPKHAG